MTNIKEIEEKLLKTAMINTIYKKYTMKMARNIDNMKIIKEMNTELDKY